MSTDNKSINQGRQANKTGVNLERFIKDVLSGEGYHFVKRELFGKVSFISPYYYTTEYYICDGIYGTKIKCDFILHHPQKYPENLIIESKWQSSSGSTDEKYPYLVHNILERYPSPCIIILDGDGYKPGAEKWLRSQVDKKKLKDVFNMREFRIWANAGNL